MTWHIFGHQWAVQLLQEHIRADRMRHAYLFVGPQGIGRRTLGLKFAKAINCAEPPAAGEACNACQNCRQIEKQAHADLSILVPEGNHKDVRIDQVRSLQHSLALRPYQARYRVALLPDFQRATPEAANAMLKTLEEPPPRVLLIVTADTLESLLPTIVSRCEVLRLRPLSIAACQQYLVQEKALPAEEANLLAHVSAGRLGYALRLHTDPHALEQRAEVLDAMTFLLAADVFARFKYAEETTKNWQKARESLVNVFSLWLTWWRDVLILISGAEIPAVNIDRVAQIRQLAAHYSLETARRMISALENGLQQLNAYGNPRLILENLLLTLPGDD